jgi:hypothetical protein
MNKAKMCINCKYRNYSTQLEEWQCWNENNINEGCEMDDFDSCENCEID